MKRIDLPPTNEKLVELIKEDPIGRNSDLANLLELLDSIEGPFSIFLDSNWGSGKTFFLKQLELVLSYLNPCLVSDDCMSDDLIKRLHLKEEVCADSIIPVYFNAWEHDYWDDPLPSLLLCLAASTDKKLTTKREASTQEIVTNLIDAAAKDCGLGIVGAAIREFSGKELLEQYYERQVLHKKVEQFITAVVQEQGNKLLLIVDELDRCKPTFAVKLLETIKTLFDDDRVVVLAAVNVPELAHSVEGMYGPGIDGCRYLSRFYDVKAAISHPKTEHYLRYQDIQYSGTKDGAVSLEIINSFGMNLRDINRYKAVLLEIEEKSKKWPSGSGHYDVAIIFARYCLVQILVAVRDLVPEDYQRIKTRADGAVLLKYIQQSPTAYSEFEYVLGSCLDEDSRAKLDEGDGSVGEKVAAAFCELIWNGDEASKNYQEAYGMLLNKAFGAKSLKFISRDVLR